jgi:ABC-type transport system involved in Fe-S cluster assembly fused permease/ATPase subunit
MTMLQKLHLLILLSFILNFDIMGQSIPGDDTEASVLINNSINWETSKEFNNNVFNKEKYPRFHEIFLLVGKKLKLNPMEV